MTTSDIVERLQSAGHLYAPPHDAIMYEAAAEIVRLRGEVGRLEEAAEEIEAGHTWITAVAASAIIRKHLRGESIAPAEVKGAVAWQVQAIDWLEAQAKEQEANNERWPEHAAAYPSWRDMPVQYRMLAAKLSQEAALRPSAGEGKGVQGG